MVGPPGARLANIVRAEPSDETFTANGMPNVFDEAAHTVSVERRNRKRTDVTLPSSTWCSFPALRRYQGRTPTPLQHRRLRRPEPSPPCGECKSPDATSGRASLGVRCLTSAPVPLRERIHRPAVPPGISPPRAFPLWQTLSVPYDVLDLSERERDQVLSTEESHTTDLKAIEVTPAKLTRTLAAFSNAEGGDLFIGVDEDSKNQGRRWRGFSRIEDANGHLQTFEAFFPLSQFVDYEFLRLRSAPEQGLVLKATIRKTPDVRRSSDSTIYVRRGAQNLPVTDSEAIRRLEYAKGVASFETHPVDVPLEFVTNSETVIGFMLEVVPNAEPLSWLEKQLLIRNSKPTVASILLFADQPQAALPKQSSAKIYRYATTDPVGSRANLMGNPLTIEGNLYDLIRDAVRTTVDLIQGIRVLTPNGMEDISYPEVTLHEIITNAALHRDYSIADDIHVRIFDDRIEIESPGGLPAHLTPQNILEQRFARNGSLVRWINKFPEPPNKDVGEGLRTAFEAMKSLKLQPPQILDKKVSVLVLVRHQRLASPEEMILEYLQNQSEISNSVVRKLTGIGSENSVKRIFQRMIRVGELEPIPGRPLRDAAYRLPSAGLLPGVGTLTRANKAEGESPVTGGMRWSGARWHAR